jgi:hypothetical protein
MSVCFDKQIGQRSNPLGDKTQATVNKNQARQLLGSVKSGKQAKTSEDLLIEELARKRELKQKLKLKRQEFYENKVKGTDLTTSLQSSKVVQAPTTV